MTKTSILPVAPSRVTQVLKNGDHLTREEFERRYDATPGLKNAELIEGRVYVPPPVSYFEHSLPHFNLINWLGAYAAATPNVMGGDNGSIRLDLDNMPQPDGFLFIAPAAGGRAVISKDGYVEGAPELVAEVSYSSVSYDLHEKFRVYRRNGVREYVVWRTEDHQIDYFILQGTEYVRLAGAEQGRFQSETFPGLWLDANALIAGDLAAVLQFVQQGVSTKDHADFVARLKSAVSPAK